MFSKEGGWKDSLPFIGLSEDIEVSQTSNKKPTNIGGRVRLVAIIE